MIMIYRNGVLMGTVASMRAALDVIEELSSLFPGNRYHTVLA